MHKHHHAALFLLWIGMLLLPACNGGGRDAGLAADGGIAITVSGLPSDIDAAVTVSGPGAFSRAVTGSTTLTSLVPGTYTITAFHVTRAPSAHIPSPGSQAVTVTSGAIAPAAVSYAAQTLSLGVAKITSDAVDPVFLAAPPNDARLFIVERAGRIRIFKNGSLLPTPFLDMRERTTTDGERGLLSLAFAPQYAANGTFFLYYTDAAGNITVERMRAAPGNPDLADPASRLTILIIPHPGFSNHNGGLVSFGPDGYLYLATGDGGGAGDPGGNAQNPTSLLGKMLRIDVGASSPAQRYAIPPTNPFAGTGQGRAEIWALGLRNPWRYAFDGAALYIADVGQERREEVDIAATAQGGINYGWSLSEGTLCLGAGTCGQTGLTLPAFEYDHGAGDANGCAITGGYVYRGAAMLDLAGHYFYSDFCKGFLKSFVYRNGAVSEHVDWAIAPIGNVASFGTDAQGELYLLSNTGVYKIGLR